MFAAALADQLLSFAYNWIGGESDKFIQRAGLETRLPPDVHLAELADLSLEFVHRLEELRCNLEEHSNTFLHRGSSVAKG